MPSTVFPTLDLMRYSGQSIPSCPTKHCQAVSVNHKSLAESTGQWTSFTRLQGRAKTSKFISIYQLSDGMSGVGRKDDMRLTDLN